jgi:hypothetical protein
MPNHPVLELLKERVEQLERFAATTPSAGPFAGYTGTGIESYVIEHGRPFVAIKRPKGYRPRAKRQCFHNAMMLAIEGRGTYVEGYAASYCGNFITEHAWVTLDNIHAIDVTWPDPEQAAYFGVPIPDKKVVAKLFLRGRELPVWLSPLR